jgi:hypothetical protein
VAYRSLRGDVILANPIIQQGGNVIRLTYTARSVIAASLDDDGLLVVTYSDGVMEDTGIGLSFIPSNAITYNGVPVTYNGEYVTYGASA